jgi:cytoskeleton protein RodZ
MNEIGIKIKDARIKQNLSVKELSEKTKVRVYVIEAIEKGDFSVMPDVYINSFIKSLCLFLKIEVPEIQQVKPTKSRPHKFDSEAIESIPVIKQTNKPITFTTESLNINNNKSSTNTTFKNIFKNNYINKERRYAILNSVVYFVLFLAVASAIYYGFYSINKSSSRLDNSEVVAGSDTVSLEDESSNLFAYFEKPDSLRLTAKAHDTVWIRVLTDGTALNESLLKPGMEESWAAKEYFIIDMGNVGGANIFRNEEKLPIFGKQGSVVKNVKITATEVTNIYPQKPDSLKSSSRKKASVKNEEPRMIQQSSIQTNSPLLKPNKDTLR